MAKYKNKSIDEIMPFVRPFGSIGKTQEIRIKRIRQQLRLFDISEVQKQKIISRVLKGY